MNYLFISFLIFVLVNSSCNKPNPTPELMDPIYVDLQKTLDETKRQLENEKKQLEEFKTALEIVVPQTGQIKYAEKRYWETLKKIEKMNQYIKFLELNLNSKQKRDRIEYLNAFNKNKPWPPKNEYEEYLQHKKMLARARKSYNQNRIEETLQQPKKEAKKAEH